MNGRKARQKRRREAIRRAELEAGTVEPTTGERIHEQKMQRDRKLALLHHEYIDARNTLEARFAQKRREIWDEWERAAALIRESEHAAKFGIIVPTESVPV